MTMSQLMKKVMNVMKSSSNENIIIKSYDNQIVFYFYESGLPIAIDKETSSVCLDCTKVLEKLDYEVLNELVQIIKLLENEVDMIITHVENLDENEDIK